MGDVKWVKFEVCMYDDTKLKILDSMENRDLHHYVWTRLLVLTGKINRGGYLYITDNIPHTIKTLAIEFNRSAEQIKVSIKILKKLEMIELTEDKVFKIKNWEKHQNVEGMERSRQLNNERVAKCRAKKKELNEKIKEDEINVVGEEITELDNNHVEEEFDNRTIQEDEATLNFDHEDIEENFNVKNTVEENNGSKAKGACNVTCNTDNSDCNVTVMEQNKKENKIKKEKKKESKSDKNINKNYDNLTDTPQEEKLKENVNKTASCPGSTNHVSDYENRNSLKNNENDAFSLENGDKNDQEATNLLKHYENITGILGGLNIGCLKLAVEMHGYKNVKMAINKALEVNKGNMTYINGILKNWRREGYPEEEGEVKKNGFRGNGKNSTADKNEFAGFKPKKPRILTEAERKRIQEILT